MQGLNGSLIMSGTAIEVTKQQRLVLAAAIIAANVLIFAVHAPAIPVIAGCVLALGVSALRSWFRIRK